MEPGIIGRDAASLDEIALSLTAGLAANSIVFHHFPIIFYCFSSFSIIFSAPLLISGRLFSVGHDLKSTLDVYRQIGNAEDILTLVKDYKAGSLAMGEKQRQYMSSVMYKEKGSPGAYLLRAMSMSSQSIV